MKQNAGTPVSPHFRHTLFSKKKIKPRQWKRHCQENNAQKKMLRCQEDGKTKKAVQA